MKSRDHLVLGVFVVAGLFLLVGSIALLGARTLFRERVTIETYFSESVTGLDRGSPVKFRGVAVGEVEEVTVVNRVYRSKDYNYAMVRLSVFPELVGLPEDKTMEELTAERVTEGMRIQLQRNAIAGISYLEAIYVTTEDPKKDDLKIDWVPEHLYIPSTRSTLVGITTSLEAILADLEKSDIQGFVGEARETLKSLRTGIKQADVPGLSQKLQGLADNASKAVESAASKLDDLVDSARTAVQNIDTGIGEVKDDVKTTLANVDQAFSELEQLLQKKEVKDALARLDKLTKEADGAMMDLRKLLQRTDRGVAEIRSGLVGERNNVGHILAGIRELTENLNRLSGTLDRYPSLMLFGNPPKPAGKGRDR